MVSTVVRPPWVATHMRTANGNGVIMSNPVTTGPRHVPSSELELLDSLVTRTGGAVRYLEGANHTAG